MKQLRLLLLTFIFCALSFFQTEALAQDTSWYSDSETVFTISTADQLQGLRSLVNSGNTFNGKEIKLDSDIDVSSTNWIPIGGGNKNGYFNGTFDGCGYTITYTISCEKCSSASYNYFGLFGDISGCTIKNLKVSGILSVQLAYYQYTSYCGGIVGYANNSNIINCYNNVIINHDRYSYHPDKSYSSYEDNVGGICGYCINSKISYCVNEAEIEDLVMYAKVYVGGICGNASSSEITNNENTGNILGFTSDVSGYKSGYTRQGGIVGYTDGYVSFCKNTGICKANNNGSVALGGIAGYGNCNNCYVASERITSNRTPKVITTKNHAINNCFANNDIIGVSITDAGVNFNYSLQQMKTIDFVNALNETTYMWVGGEGVLPVVLGSMNETDAYTTRPLPETVVLNMTDVDMPLGSEMQLSASVLPEHAWQTVVWESSNPDVVSVTETGLLTGKTVGNSTITVTSAKNNLLSASCQVHVGTRELKQIVLPEVIEVHYDEEHPLNITLLPSYADNDLIYESKDESVVTIEQGKLRGVGVGETEITIKDQITGIQASSIVRVYLEVGDTFIADVSNGTNTVATTFVITDVENLHVCIGNGSNAAISNTSVGNIIIPQTIIGSSNLSFTIKAISSKAFASSKISAVTIPSGITTIGDNAFNGCSSLKSVTVESTEPLAINSTCFSIKAGATLYVPKGCYEVYKTADVWKDFGTIVEPAYTNGDTFVASITAGSGTTNATFMVIDAANKYVSVGNGEESAIADYTSGKVVVPSTVKGYDGQTYQVKQLNKLAFFYCYELTSVELPNGITTLGEASFFECNALTSFSIPTTVTTIDDLAFEGCYNLTTISIPVSVTSLGSGAFYGCSKLTYVTTNWSEPIAIDDECFTNAGNATLNIPKGSYRNYSSADNWKNFKTIKEPAHSVGDTFVASVTTNDSPVDATFKVTNTSSRYVSIGDGENAAIDIFTSGNVEVPSSVKGYDAQTYTVKKIADAAFFGCEDVTLISLPSGITGIGNSAFLRCYNLASITIPTSVTTIGGEAFFYCEKLTSISIPKNVTSIGTKAFKNCGLLTSVTVGWNTPISIDTECFSNAANATLNVPYGSKERYEAATGWKEFKNIVEMAPKDGDVFTALTAEGVKMTFTITSASKKTCKVGDGYNASISTNTEGLVTIPTTANGFAVTQISYKAFYNCNKITATEIPTCISSIGADAFDGCNNLTSVTVGWDEPIAISTNCFSNAENATLYVPIETNSKYKSATGWKNFGQIVNMTNSILFANDVIVCRGGQITLPIMLSNKDNVRNLQFELALPEGISVVTNEMGELVGASLSERAKATHTITGTREANGNYRVMIMPKGITDDIIQGSEGLIANVKLKVTLNVVPKDYDIKMTACELTVDDGESLSAILQDAHSKLTVSSVLLGDIKDNGEVTVTDVSNLIDYLLHKQVSNFTRHAADINGDDIISVSDISILIDILLHKTVFGEKQALKKEELPQ